MLRVAISMCICLMVMSSRLFIGARLVLFAIALCICFPHAQCVPSGHLVLQSVGWSEAHMFFDEIVQGVVIDISQCCRDWDRSVLKTWFVFGGEGTEYDDRMRQNFEFQGIAELLRRIVAIVCAAMHGTLQRVVVTVICSWGKHRSRLQVEDVCRWLLEQIARKVQRSVTVTVSHLSEEYRRKEIVVFEEVRASNHRLPWWRKKQWVDPLLFAKTCGYRTDKCTWPCLKKQVRNYSREFFWDCSWNRFDEFLRKLILAFGVSSCWMALDRSASSGGSIPSDGRANESRCGRSPVPQAKKRPCVIKRPNCPSSDGASAVSVHLRCGESAVVQGKQRPCAIQGADCPSSDAVSAVSVQTMSGDGCRRMASRGASRKTNSSTVTKTHQICDEAAVEKAAPAVKSLQLSRGNGASKDSLQAHSCEGGTRQNPGGQSSVPAETPCGGNASVRSDLNAVSTNSFEGISCKFSHQVSPHVARTLPTKAPPGMRVANRGGVEFAAPKKAPRDMKKAKCGVVERAAPKKAPRDMRMANCGEVGEKRKCEDFVQGPSQKMLRVSASTGCNMPKGRFSLQSGTGRLTLATPNGSARHSESSSRTVMQKARGDFCADAQVDTDNNGDGASVGIAEIQVEGARQFVTISGLRDQHGLHVTISGLRDQHSRENAEESDTGSWRASSQEIITLSDSEAGSECDFLGPAKAIGLDSSASEVDTFPLAELIVNNVQGVPAECHPSPTQMKLLEDDLDDIVKLLQRGCGKAVVCGAVCLQEKIACLLCAQAFAAREALDNLCSNFHGLYLSILSSIADAASSALRLGDTQTVVVWKHVLISLEGSRWSLSKAIYASIIVEAFARLLLEPMCLLTPRVFSQIHSQKRLLECLEHCCFMETATSVLRMFYTAATCDLLTFQRLWNVLPFCGVAGRSLECFGGIDIVPIAYDVFRSASREQFCNINAVDTVWEPPRPPYADHFDIMVPCDLKYVARLPAIAPLSIVCPCVAISREGKAEQQLQVNDRCHIVMLCPLLDRNVWHQLLAEKIINWRLSRRTDVECTQDDIWKLVRQIGARAKALLGLDSILHWQLRQSVEGYLGHVIYSLYRMELPAEAMCTGRTLCLAAGVSFEWAPDCCRDTRWRFSDGSQDAQMQKFNGTYLGSWQFELCLLFSCLISFVYLSVVCLCKFC